VIREERRKVLLFCKVFDVFGQLDIYFVLLGEDTFFGSKLNCLFFFIVAIFVLLGNVCLCGCMRWNSMSEAETTFTEVLIT